jgi:hypothetical protein
MSRRCEKARRSENQVVYFSVHSDGVTHSNQVRLTAVRFELLGKDYGQTSFEAVDLAVASLMKSPTDPDLAAVGMTPGAYQIHKVRIFDPRTSGISQMTINGQSLALTREGTYYTTPDFMLIDPASTGTAPTGVVAISQPDEFMDWDYNPSGRRRAHTPVVPSEWDNELATLVKDIQAKLKDDEWAPTGTPNTGAYGIEVHRQVSAALAGKPNWLIDVFVENDTNRIVASSGTNRTQIDVLRVVDGYAPQVGDILDRTKIVNLYDVKASLNGTLTSDQLGRLKKVLALNSSKQITVVRTPERWIGGTWQPVKAYNNGLKLLSAIGLSSAAYTMLQGDVYASELNEIARQGVRNSRETDPYLKKLDQIALLEGPVKDYLEHFLPPNQSLDWAIHVKVLDILGELEPE